MPVAQQVDITPKISKDSIPKFLFYSFLVAGYLNTVLRPSPESDITLFRVILPVMLLIYSYFFTSSTVRIASIIFIFLSYGILCSLINTKFHSFNFIYFLHYATIIFIGAFIFSLVNRFGIRSLYNHLRIIYLLMIFLAIFQFFIGFKFPNTEYLGTINIYYWVDNDFGSALAAFIPFLIMDKRKKVANFVLASLGVAIIVYNGSRIAMLSVIFYLLFISLNRLRIVGYLLAGILGTGMLLYFEDYKFGGDSLSQLTIDPFLHIATLTPYGLGGSIYDRTDALIFGIKELFSSYGFGIGPGNATKMLSLPEYFLISAKSMHNFIAQIFVEYGWLMLITIAFSLYKAYYYRRGLGIRKEHDAILYTYLIAAALASLSQSEGLFTNYFFFVCIFFSFSYFGNNLKQDKI